MTVTMARGRAAGRRLSGALAAGALLWLAFAALPAAGADEREALAERALTLSGWARQIEEVPGLARSALDERAAAGDVSPDAAAALRGVLDRAFDPQRIRTDTLHAFLRVEAPAEKLEALVALLERPLARRMTELELQASTPEGQEALRDFVHGLGGHPPQQSRLALIDRLDTATGARPFAVEMMAVITEGVLRAAEAATPQHLRTPPRELEQRIADLRPALERRLYSLVLVSQLYTYHGVDDAELTEYVTLLESPLGRWFSRNMGGAFLDALSRAAEAAVEAVRGRTEV